MGEKQEGKPYRQLETVAELTAQPYHRRAPSLEADRAPSDSSAEYRIKQMRTSPGTGAIRAIRENRAAESLMTRGQEKITIAAPAPGGVKPLFCRAGNLTEQRGSGAARWTL